MLTRPTDAWGAGRHAERSPLASLHEDGHLGLLTDSARLATVVDDFLLGANRSPDRERPIRPS